MRNESTRTVETDTPAIVCEQLSLTYDDRRIINNFSAEIATGEFIGIFGPNGSGKTTLFRAILGLLKPSAGKIAVLNIPAQRGNSAIGYMPQMRSIASANNFSGRAVVSAAVHGYRWGLPLLTKPQQDEVSRVLTLVAADDFVDRPYAELSGGEKQRLLLAQVLLGNPQIVLLDEPLTNLDPRSQENLITLIQQIQQQLRVTVLFTAHDVNPLLGVMDRVLYLANGNGKLGTVDEVMTSEQLTALYGIPMEVIELKQRLFVFSREKGVTDHVTHCH